MNQYGEKNRKVLERWDREAAEQDAADLTKLRDQFAMAALTGLLARDFSIVSVAGEAFHLADEMMNQRAVLLP